MTQDKFIIKNGAVIESVLAGETVFDVQKTDKSSILGINSDGTINLIGNVNPSGNFTNKLKITNGGISVTGVTTGETIFYDSSGGIVLRGRNTGDQDLSNLSTYDYVDQTFLKLAGGTLTNGIEIQNTLNGTSYASGGGGYNPYYNNIILRGSSSAGSSGILFTSSKGTTSINQTSDKAFIQYHPYGVTLSDEGSLPTIGTTGESGKLVIGVGNDDDDMVYIQAPSTTGIKHIVGTNIYTIWDSGNFTNLNQLTTRNFSDLQNIPTTLSGYGITDAIKNNGLTESYVPMYTSNGFVNSKIVEIGDRLILGGGTDVTAMDKSVIIERANSNFSRLVVHNTSNTDTDSHSILIFTTKYLSGTNSFLSGRIGADANTDTTKPQGLSIMGTPNLYLSSFGFVNVSIDNVEKINISSTLTTIKSDTHTTGTIGFGDSTNKCQMLYNTTENSIDFIIN